MIIGDKVHEGKTKMIREVDRRYFKLAVGKIKKDSDNDISCSCPACGETRNRLHLYDSGNGDALVFCYNSGCELNDSAAPLGKFLDVIESPYLSGYKRETLGVAVDQIKNEISMGDILKKIKTKTDPDFDLEPAKTNELEIPLHHFDKASSNQDAVEYLKIRGINEIPDNWYFSTDEFFTHNKKTMYVKDYLIIPILNKHNKIKGFYSRSIREKRFSTYLLDTEKVWTQNPKNPPEIFAEGIFDALSTGFENPAAMLGAGLSQGYRNSLSKDVIFAFDNDKTGREKSLEYIDYGFKVFVWPNLDIKDFNELVQKGASKETIKQMILDNCYSGIQAKIRIRMRER